MWEWLTCLSLSSWPIEISKLELFCCRALKEGGVGGYFKVALENAPLSFACETLLCFIVWCILGGRSIAVASQHSLWLGCLDSDKLYFQSVCECVCICVWFSSALLRLDLMYWFDWLIKTALNVSMTVRYTEQPVTGVNMQVVLFWDSQTMWDVFCHVI